MDWFLYDRDLHPQKSIGLGKCILNNQALFSNFQNMTGQTTPAWIISLKEKEYISVEWQQQEIFLIHSFPMHFFSTPWKHQRV